MATDQEHGLAGDMEVVPRRLHAHVVWHWRASSLLGVAGLAGVLLLLDRLADAYVPTMLIPIVVGLALVTAWMWAPLEYQSWSYQVREQQLWAQRGVLSRTTSVIPYVRIQHVDTRQDVVERALGLARVVVFTAGIRGAELVLPGLPADEANQLRDRLAELAGVEHAV
jgi:membrane protein YdbS with pleckstrin-like domain